MTAAQQRNRDINRQIEKSDKLFRFYFGITGLLLMLFTVLTFMQVLKVNTNLQAQIERSRANTNSAVQSIQQDNERVHNEQTAFLKCVLLIPREERSEARINDCIDASEGRESAASSAQTNNTPDAQVQSVTNNTVIPESTPPPKAPEQPEPLQPVPTAPPPKDVTPVTATIGFDHLLPLTFRLGE